MTFLELHSELVKIKCKQFHRNSVWCAKKLNVPLNKFSSKVFSFRITNRFLVCSFLRRSCRVSMFTGILYGINVAIFSKKMKYLVFTNCLLFEKIFDNFWFGFVGPKNYKN